MRLLKSLLMAAALLAGAGCAGAPPPMDADVEGGRRLLGVNAHLWRASLEVLSFMPLVTIDPFGGVIISDWYSPTPGASERLKVTVHIADRALRADALKVTVFRQERSTGDWRGAPSNPQTHAPAGRPYPDPRPQSGGRQLIGR
jgi:hypothetical protein